jgi:hypothetical protein
LQAEKRRPRGFLRMAPRTESPHNANMQTTDDVRKFLNDEITKSGFSQAWLSLNVLGRKKDYLRDFLKLRKNGTYKKNSIGAKELRILEQKLNLRPGAFTVNQHQEQSATEDEKPIVFDAPKISRFVEHLREDLVKILSSEKDPHILQLKAELAIREAFRKESR